MRVGIESRKEKPVAELPAITAQCEAMLASLRNNGGIDALCDAILEDLKSLCSQIKKLGGEEGLGLRMPITSGYISKGRFAGHYIGIGLGSNWLDFGLLEREVIAVLRERFKSQQVAFKKHTSDDIETMTGWVEVHDEFYKTRDGVFMLTHTYAWFIKRRVD